MEGGGGGGTGRGQMLTKKNDAAAVLGGCRLGRVRERERKRERAEGGSSIHGE